MKRAVRLRQPNPPRQQGEGCRIKVVKGPDAGTVFIVTGSIATIGRGEENDIVLSDLKSSRLHAELRHLAEGWQILDMGSANGVLVNGQGVKSAVAKDGDLVQVGETVFEFVSAGAATVFLTAPPKTPVQLQQERAAQVYQQERLKKITTVAPAARALPGAGGLGSAGARNRLGLILGVAAVGGFWFWLDSKPPAPGINSGSTQRGASRDPASLLSGIAPEPSIETKRKADLFFKVGLREYRERNFIRARGNFETALQIDSGHALARIYYENCGREIKEEVEFHLDRGGKAFHAGRLRDSKAHYEAVTRLLQMDQSQPAFMEARTQLEEVRKVMRGVASEKRGSE